MKKCPYCSEQIQDEAIKCRHCGEWLNKGIESKNKSDSNLIKPPPLPQGSKSSTSNTVKIWYKNGTFIFMTKFISIFILLSIYAFIMNSDSSYNLSKKESSVDQNEIAAIRDELENIHKDEYGREPSGPCRDEKSPGGEGYYMVGGGLIGHSDLAMAVYNARKYCQFRFKSSNTSFCLTGVDMAVRNISNLNECYKSKFNKELPTKFTKEMPNTNSVNKKSSRSRPSDAEIDAMAEQICDILGGCY